MRPIVALLAIAAAGWPASAGAAPARPELVVRAASAMPAPGGRLRLAATVRNVGARPAAPSRTEFRLIGRGGRIMFGLYPAAAGWENVFSDEAV